MSEQTHSVYTSVDYKQAIKDRVKYLRAKRPGLTMKELASRASMQHTYLSRCLNDDRTHIGEDQLFVLAEHMELLPDEIDFLMLLRSHDTSQESLRKKSLFKKIDTARKRHLTSSEHREWTEGNFHEEMRYLFNPLCHLVHASLFVKEFAANPRLLISPLGISLDQLKEILMILHKNDYIFISSDDPFKVREVYKKYPHFGREHPLTRPHQAALKSVVQSRLNQTPEANKESLLYTFTTDDEGFEKICAEIKIFVRKVQEITFDTKQKHLYQLNLDFFKWL